jgi:hypothetical protein
MFFIMTFVLGVDSTDGGFDCKLDNGFDSTDMPTGLPLKINSIGRSTELYLLYTLGYTYG